MEACQRGNRQEVRADLEHFFQTHAPAYAGQVLDGFDYGVNKVAAAWNREQACSDQGWSLMKQRVDSFIERDKDGILKTLPPGAASLPAPPRQVAAALPQSVTKTSSQQAATVSATPETQSARICPATHDSLAHPPISWEEERKQVEYYCSKNWTLSHYDTACCVEQYRQARLQAGPCADKSNVALQMHYSKCGSKN